MKLSVYARKIGVTYKTAYNHWKRGIINGKQLETGTIIVFDNEPKEPTQKKVAIYARVSSNDRKNQLDTQADRIKTYCVAKGYTINKIVKEIASALNDNRPKFISLLQDNDIDIIVAEHKDRVTRFGFNYIKTLLNNNNKDIEIINLDDKENIDIMEDFVSIVTSFCPRIYGKRKSKRCKEKILENLNEL